MVAVDLAVHRASSRIAHLAARQPSPGGRGLVSVGYVMDRFPRGSHGFVLEEILELESGGADVHVFSVSLPEGHVDDTAHALARLRNPVCYFSADTDINGDTDIGVFSGKTSSPAALWLARHVTARHLEHLHAHGAVVATEVAREAARLTGLGYSFTAHADDVRDDVAASTREKVLEARFAVTLSDYDHGRLLRICGRGASNTLHRISMGVNAEAFGFTDAASRDADSILAVGPLVEKSGFADLIEAVLILRDTGRAVRLTILGEGGSEDAIRALIDGAGLSGSVQVIGGASRRDAAALMRAHTLLVLPWAADDGDRDALASLVLEGMASGLPVLAPDMPSLREVIHDGLTGRLIMHRDPVGLAGAMETFLGSAPLRARIAANARTAVERMFNAQRNVSRLARLFEVVAGRRVASEFAVRAFVSPVRAVGGHREPVRPRREGTHVPFGTLIDYVRGLGTSETPGWVRAHLSACTRCAEKAARLARLSRIARAALRTEPPEEVVDAAIALFNAVGSPDLPVRLSASNASRGRLHPPRSIGRPLERD